MIDIPATLAPAAGVARNYAVVPPCEGNPLWSSGVELQPSDGFTGAADAPLSSRYAGASGTTRTDALLRGAGEAVERRALHPSPSHPTRFGTADELGAPTLSACHPGHALAHPDAETAALHWYEARSLETVAPVLVPADLVDWPARSARLFDPSPSGAASGTTRDAALGAALIEVAERDALTAAWGRQLRLPAYRPSPQDTLLAPVWRRAEEQGLTPVLARIPLAVPGLWCMTALLIDPDGTGALATVGMKASVRPTEAAVKAFQEAWQVRTALQTLLARGESAHPDPVVTEHDRMCHMLSRSAYDTIRAWADGFQAPEPLPDPAGTAGPLAAQDLVEAMNADGAGLLAIDLTHRLTPAVAAMGWHAVKVLAPGYQNLRMDETHHWSWHLSRLASAPERTGCQARLDDPRLAAPHPLP
ncbi:YcaO-like family protein [Streptomyces incanus]|uniref:YcaO-like family protein n=1 Tax=Streptomyces incanus TaxID=887453 RepID=A0ABW0XP23_9ACTN